MEQPKTLCVKCTHLKAIQDGPRTGIWYNMRCRAPGAQRVPWVDPVGGGVVYGNRAYDEPEPYCRDINNGHCPHYEPKRSLWDKAREAIKPPKAAKVTRIHAVRREK